MGPANLENAAKGLGFGEQCGVEFVQRRNEMVNDSVEGGEMNGGGDDVITGLAAVDVVIGMHGFITAFAAEDFNRAIGDDLVGIHVRGSAGAGLENIHDKLVVPFAVNHFLRSVLDGLGDLRWHITKPRIGGGGVLLDQAERADKLPGKAQAADRKILDGPGGLRAVIGVGGDFHLAHGVSFDTKFFCHCRNLPIPAIFTK